jgi:alpha-L-rhamnosidase
MRNGRVAENTQTAYALALNFGLLTAAEEAGAADRIVADVALHDGHLTTGFLGTPELSHALSQHGHIETAYALLMQRGYPSWLYPITRGATTMWERWDGIKPDGSFEEISMNSFNHYAFGAIGDWMYRNIGGIDIDPMAPGYHHVIIAPKPGGKLTSARTTLQTGYGVLATDWTLTGGLLTLKVTIPPNTSATVTMPGTNVRLDGGVAGGAAGVRAARDNVIEIGSGRYVLTATGVR